MRQAAVPEDMGYRKRQRRHAPPQHTFRMIDIGQQRANQRQRPCVNARGPTGTMHQPSRADTEYEMTSGLHGKIRVDARRHSNPHKRGRSLPPHIERGSRAAIGHHHIKNKSATPFAQHREHRGKYDANTTPIQRQYDTFARPRPAFRHDSIDGVICELYDPPDRSIASRFPVRSPRDEPRSTSKKSRRSFR